MTALCIICNARPQAHQQPYCAHCIQHEADLIDAVEAAPDLKQELIDMAEAERRYRETIVDPTPDELAAHQASDNQDFIESISGTVRPEFEQPRRARTLPCQRRRADSKRTSW